MNLGERLGLMVAPSVEADAPERPARPEGATSWAGALLLGLALVGSLYGLYLIDVPIARFVRSLQHPLGYLIDPRLARLSHFGDWAGGGIQLVSFSLGVWAIGWLAGRSVWLQVGAQSLLAHGMAALLTNGLKRLLGRPRPKFSHAGEFQLWPSMDNGFDSFPSGHASASFAVAAVLAAHVPQARWVWYGLAFVVSWSRVFRSAHFPTDIVVGALLGVAVGWVVSHRLSRWRVSLLETLEGFAPAALALFAVLWVGSGAIERHPLAIGMFWAGAVLAGLGIARRWLGDLSSQHCLARTTGRPASWAMTAGLALATASAPVFLLGALLVTGQRLRAAAIRHATGTGAAPVVPIQWWPEVVRVAALLLALTFLWNLPGSFPLR